jgi:hypothetical protein
MITRRGRTVLEDIREYWGEMTDQAGEAHRAAKKPAAAPDGAVLMSRLAPADHAPVGRRLPPAPAA